MVHPLRGDYLSPLSVSRLVGRFAGRVVPFRPLVSFSCRIVGRCAVFLSSFSHVVSFCRCVCFLNGRHSRPVCRFVESVSSCVSFVVLPIGSLCVSGFLSSRPIVSLVVSQGVSFHPIVLVALSVSPCPGPCLIEREHPCLVPPWVSGGASCRRLFCSHSRRSLARRRFPQLRFPSEVSVDCLGSSCGMAWPSSSLVPCVLAPASLSCVPSRSVSASRSSARLSVRLVSPVRRPVFRYRLVCLSRSHGVVSSLPIRTRRFPQLNFPSVPLLRSSRGGVRANRLTGHRGRRPFHMGHRGNAIGERNRGTPTRHETQDGERRMTRMKTTTETTGARHERRR